MNENIYTSSHASCWVHHVQRCHLFLVTSYYNQRCHLILVTRTSPRQFMRSRLCRRQTSGYCECQSLARDCLLCQCSICPSFSQHGSIFFAESVSKELRERPLYSESPDDPLWMDLAGRFRIGPTVNRES